MAQKNTITVAIAGNPNCGKSTIFNHLTNSNQHVGNYPGVTVEKKEGKAKFKGNNFVFVDLPGTYSLSGHSEDEVVAKNYILTAKPDVIVHVIDTSNLERNLYLYTELAELGLPMILAMNMTDVVEAEGSRIDYGTLSNLLGKPLIKTTGNKNKGTEDLCQCIVDVYSDPSLSKETGIDFGEDVLRECRNIEETFSYEKEMLSIYPSQWLAIKLIEGSGTAIDIVSNLKSKDKVLAQVEKSCNHLQHHFNDAVDVLMAERRYGYINGVMAKCVKPTLEERFNVTEFIDRIVLNSVLGIPIFIAVMYLIFKFTFTFSEPVVGWLEIAIIWLSEIMTFIIPEGLIQSLVVDGIIGGVGGVLSFYPLVLFMFFAIAFFEDSGYMARAAFVMDRAMHKFGLHGKSFLPLVIATNGCAVPGILATRTLDNKNDRLITMMVTPFMICGAKLPIFVLFIAAFFPVESGANMMFLMYTLSVAIAFISSWGLKKFVFKGGTSNFVMELPPYRMPTLKGLLLKMWERGWLYIKKAGSIILMISIVLWFLFSFPQVELSSDISEEASSKVQLEQSYAGKMGKLIEPAIEPLGMDWRAGVSLIAGTVAKEIVVSTMGTMYKLGEVDLDNPKSLKESMQADPMWTPLKAFTFLMFTLIYFPCFVSVSVFYRESGSSMKWTSFLVIWTTLMAWGVAFCVYRIGMILGW